MKRIYKYRLRVDQNDGNPKVLMPIDAKILHFDVLSHAPKNVFFWAIVGPGLRVEDRHFKVFGTGDDIEDLESLKYLATVRDGVLVWHIFEKK